MNNEYKIFGAFLSACLMVGGNFSFSNESGAEYSQSSWQKLQEEPFRQWPGENRREQPVLESKAAELPWLER